MKKILLTLVGFLFCVSFLPAQVVLYGLTSKGGSGGGTIIKYQSASNTLEAVFAFDAANGITPNGSLLQASDNKLYGMTSDGGANGYGTIFSYDPVSNVFTKLYDFDGINGAEPNGSLIQAADGKLYGMTTFGGVNNRGTIFSYDPITAKFAKLHEFEKYNGMYPYGSLIQYTDGKLYGMTNGLDAICQSRYCDADGIAFSFNPLGGTFEKDFQFYPHSNPYGSFTLGADGSLYSALTFSGFGRCDYTIGDGGVFAFRPGSPPPHTTNFRDFGSNGKWPYGDLIQASDSKLYGMTFESQTSDCNSPNKGEIFSYDTNTTVITDGHIFTGPDGSSPYGTLMQASDGNLYGMTSAGGSNNMGVVFSYNLNGSVYAKLQDFAGANGATPIYGKFIELRKVSQITTSINGTTFSAGSSLPVSYTATGSYKTANIFTAQLSDASGSFASPVNIGKVTSTASGTIQSVIPANTAIGTGYRIRVVASDTSVKATDNGSNITINNASVVSYRINAGGPQVTNSIGTFVADTLYSPAPGNIYSVTTPIAGTTNAAMYQTERYGTNDTLGYALPVANGTYMVTLHFAELYWKAAGQRLFDVSIEGKKVLDNYDIFKKVGAFTATSETFTVTVTDGILNIRFSSLPADGGVDQPKVSAIEVLNTSPIVSYRINAGGPQVTNSIGTFAADTLYSPAPGNIYSVTTPIAGTTNAAMYQTERYGTNDTLSYALPVANGTYTVTLHFAELYWTAAGKRLFDVSIEGKKVLDNYDIFKKVGAFTATSETFTVTVTDGILNIRFSSLPADGGVDQPKVSAIEVLNITPIVSYRINAGGPQVTNSIGTFAADTLYSPAPGNIYSVTTPIAGTTNAAMYQTERYGTNDTLGYALPVANGTYTVTLHFAELYWKAAGKRLFDVSIEGKKVLDNYDIFKKVGAFTATSETFTVTVTDGILNIRFSSLPADGGVDQPKVSAIEVLNTTPIVSYRINAGGPQVTNSIGTFAADTLYSPAPGNIYSVTTPIAGTTNAAMYQTERYGTNDTMSYTLPVANGTYTVTLHFAELYWKAAGKRLFDVSIEGNKVLDNYDIFSKVSAFTATSETFTITVTDGILNIHFSSLPADGGVDQPKVSAIEVLSGSYAPAVNSNFRQAITTQWPTTKLPVVNTLKAFPNPSSNSHYTVLLADKIEGEVSYTLLSLTGTRLLGGTLLINKPTSSLDFDFSREMMSQGEYYLLLESQKLKAHVKLMHLK